MRLDLVMSRATPLGDVHGGSGCEVRLHKAPLDGSDGTRHGEQSTARFHHPARPLHTYRPRRNPVRPINPVTECARPAALRNYHS
jgi:hypothetical protein